MNDGVQCYPKRGKDWDVSINFNSARHFKEIKTYEGRRLLEYAAQGS